MAVTITTTYAGEKAGEYIAAALLSGNTLDGGLITVKPNIKFKQVIKKGALTGIVKDSTCAFTTAGDLVLNERIIEPKKLQVNFEACKNDFISDWDALQMGYSANDVLPSSVEDFIIAQMSASVAQETEKSIWVGDKTVDGEFDGFLTLFAADADITTALGNEITGVAITATNVIDELQKVYDAIPDELFNAPSLSIHVATNVAKAYATALGSLTGGSYMAWGTTGEKPLDFNGIPLRVANGLKASNMVAGVKENLWFGTGLLNDQNSVRLLDMADLDGSENVRFIMKYTASVQYGFGSEIVWYNAA